jgi:methylglutaconyl-CoA hydratase
MDVRKEAVVTDNLVMCELDGRGVARITLNRPDVHNAWKPDLVVALRAAVEAMARREEVRVIVLAGAGRSFSAGGDLRWMRGVLDLSAEQRRHDALQIGELLLAIDSCPKPVVARIQGAAIGGGFGLVCCADVAIASTRASFGLSEVRLGIVPAMISPFVVHRLGEALARARFMAGHDPLSAQAALAVGLVHCVVEPDELDAAIAAEVDVILRAAPGAIAETKRLFRSRRAASMADALAVAADALVARWETAEAREGLQAFLDKRRAAWVATK